MAEDAIRGYLESLRKRGETIPIEQGEPITEMTKAGGHRPEGLPFTVNADFTIR